MMNLHQQISLYDYRHENNFRSSSISPTPTLSSKSTNGSWQQVEDELENDSVNTTSSTWQEEAHWFSFRLAVQKFAHQKNISEEEEDQSISYFSDSRGSSCSWMLASEEAPSQELNDVNSSLASDLLETKMMLALAQAERDELEFALLQREQHKK